MTDTDFLDWLNEQIVDVIYLDDGRVIDVCGNDIRGAISKAMKAKAAGEVR